VTAPAPSPPTGAADPGHGRARAAAQRAWCLYDWGNSAFATSIVAAILPVYFAAVAGRVMPAHLATAWWAYGSAAAMLIAAVAGPLLGAAADRIGRRVPVLVACVAVGAAATALLAVAPAGDWRALLVLFGVGFVAFASANVLYDALLPAVAGPGEMHRLSARGFAWGYAGGGLLLAVHLALVTMPGRFGLADGGQAVRIAFASVALWWAGFTVPLVVRVRETGVAAPGGAGPLDTLREVGRTLAGLRLHPERLRFLIAFWLYSDGIGTVIKIATVYGSEVGIGRNDLIGALLLVQILAAPASLAFGRLAGPLGPQRAVALGLAGYVGITVLGYFLSRPWHFWAIAVLVAMVQGGTQALSRSMYASLVPARRTAELFGFYSVSEKLAGVIGPLLFGLVAQATGAGRFAVLTLLPFFVGGAWLLLTVDLDRGRARAADENAAAAP
jgi:UMF1 family MFS transporter